MKQEEDETMDVMKTYQAHGTELFLLSCQIDAAICRALIAQLDRCFWLDPSGLIRLALRSHL